MKNKDEIDRLLNEVFYANKYSVYFIRIGWVVTFIIFLLISVAYAGSSFSSVQLGLIMALAVGVSFFCAFEKTYAVRFSRYDEKLGSYSEYKNVSPFTTFRFRGRESEKWANDARRNEVVYLIGFSLKMCLFFSILTIPVAALISFLAIKYL